MLEVFVVQDESIVPASIIGLIHFRANPRSIRIQVCVVYQSRTDSHGGTPMARAIGSTVDPLELVPPLEAKWVYRLMDGGLAACGIAAVLGLIGEAGPGALSSLRLVLVAIGTLVAGVTLTMRAEDRIAWLLAGAVGWLAVFGLPNHWDSARLVAGVLGTLAFCGAALLTIPQVYQRILISLGILFHFGAILTATTWPTTYSSPAPWVTDQMGGRVYHPYHKFMYLSNAYHFYSPDPGPASHLFFLVEYELDEEDRDPTTNQVKMTPEGQPAKKRVSEWVDMPKRRTQFRDPLGMTYYRRLSLTELVAYSTPGTALPFTPDKAGAMQRRRDNDIGLNGRPVPGARIGNDLDLSQYRLPNERVRKLMFPSYARHVARELSGPRPNAKGEMVNHTVRRVKMFRVEHRVLQPNQLLIYPDARQLRYTPTESRDANWKPNLVGGLSPFHPSTYSPYYLGEYDTEGVLVNPDDPLLYWLLPITHLPFAAKDQKSYRDLMSEFTDHEFIWEGKE
jgi:hypothetical protein